MPFAAPPKPPEAPNKRNVALVTLLCTAAAGACIQLTASSEGFVAKARPDPVGIPTGCFGETEDIDLNRIYSRDECATKLRVRLARDYAPKIAACLPQVAVEPRVRVFAALLDAAYNAGPEAVCRSPMAARVRVDDIKGACDVFVVKGHIGPLQTHGWFTTGRYQGKPMPSAVMQRQHWTWAAGAWRKEFPGLVTRRVEEAELCRS
jgi:lysozyme